MPRSEITQSNNIRCLTVSDTVFIDICFVLRHSKMINGQPDMTRHSLHVTTFKFYQNFYSDFLNIMNFCGSLWILKTLFSVYSKVVNHTRTLDDTTSSRRHSRLKMSALVPCSLSRALLPTRLSQKKKLKYGEKFQISLEIPREFLSGNSGVIQVRYLLRLHFVLCYILSGFSGNEKKIV